MAEYTGVSRSRFWLCRCKIFFLLTFLGRINCNGSTITTITASYELNNNQRFGCVGKPVTLTCTTNSTILTWEVNDVLFLFGGSRLEILNREGITSALVDKSNDLSILSVFFQSLPNTVFNTSCADGSATYSIIPAGIPQPPLDIKVIEFARSSQATVLKLSWSAPSLSNFDLDHYQVTVNEGKPMRVRDESVLVNTSVPMGKEMMVPVSITVVDKCGQQSSPGTAMVRIEATTAADASTQQGDMAGIYMVATIILAVLLAAVLVGIVLVAAAVLFLQHHRTMQVKGSIEFVSTDILTKRSPERS